MKRDLKVRIRLTRSMGSSDSWHLDVEDIYTSTRLMSAEIQNDALGDLLSARQVETVAMCQLNDTCGRQMETRTYEVPRDCGKTSQEVIDRSKDKVPDGFFAQWASRTNKGTWSVVCRKYGDIAEVE